jgi:hypothetical protein
VVQAYNADFGDTFDHRFNRRPRDFEQMPSHFLEQVPALFGSERFDEVLLGGCQDAFETNDHQITDQMGVNLLWSTAHVLLLKSTHALRNFAFDFALSLHP